MPDVTRLGRRVEADFGTDLAAVDRAADAVADEWAGETTTDRTAVADALESRLRADGTADALLGIVATVADALDTTPPAEPVARPPYFVVTGEGPMVRVSLDDPPVRVVVLLRAFQVDSDGRGAVYRRTDDVHVEVTVESTE